MYEMEVGVLQNCRQGVSLALTKGQLSRWAAADSIAPQAMRLGILGLPCFTAEKRQRLDRKPIDFFFCRRFLNIGTFFSEFV